MRNGFDLRNILGKPCLISVVHGKGKKKDTETGKYIMYSNVGGVMAIPKGMDVPEMDGQVLLYDSENPEAYDRLPKFLSDMVDNRVDRTLDDTEQPTSKDGEYSVPPDPQDERAMAKPSEGMEDDDIPF